MVIFRHGKSRRWPRLEITDDTKSSQQAFGPARHANGVRRRHAVAAFLKARREGRPLEIFGDGEQTRDFTHVSDVVSANMLAMDCQVAVADGRAINIGRGENVSVNRIAAMIGGPTVHREGRAGDMRDTLADRTQAKRVLGWRPRVSIEAGIAESLKGSGSPSAT